MAELGTVFVDVEPDAQKIESGFGKVAKAAAGVFAAAFAGKKLFDFGADAVGQANDLNESLNAVQQTFDSYNGDVLLDIGEQAAERFGLAQSEFNAFAVSFGGFAKQIQPGNEAQVIRDITERAADFASVMNLEVNDAGEKFQSIMAGSSEVARQYGLDVSAAAVEQFAMESGLASSKEEMTEAIKVQARYGILMQQTEQWAGDFASTSDQLANSTRIAQAEFKDAQAELGQALLPVLAEVVGMARDNLIPIISELQPVFQLVAEAVAQLAPPILELVKKLIPLVSKILPVLVDILTVVIELFLAVASPILDLISAALDPLIEILWPLVDVLFEALQPALIAFAELVQALMPLIDLLIPLIAAAAEIVGFLAQIIGEGLAATLRVFAGLIERGIKVVTPFVEWLTNLAKIIGGALSDNLSGIINWFRELPGKILAAVDKAAEWLTTTGRDAVQGFITGLVNKVSDLIQWFRDLPGNILRWIGNAAKWLIDTGKDLISGFISGIRDSASRIVTAIKNYVINKIPGPIKSFFGISSPSKLMAEFGRNISEGMAMGIQQGSGDVDKAVESLLQRPSPLNLGFQSRDLATAGAGLGVTQVFHGPVVGSLDEFAGEVSDAFGREMRYRLA